MQKPKRLHFLSFAWTYLIHRVTKRAIAIKLQTNVEIISPVHFPFSMISFFFCNEKNMIIRERERERFPSNSILTSSKKRRLKVHINKLMKGELQSRSHLCKQNSRSSTKSSDSDQDNCHCSWYFPWWSIWWRDYCFLHTWTNSILPVACIPRPDLKKTKHFWLLMANHHTNFLTLKKIINHFHDLQSNSRQKASFLDGPGLLFLPSLTLLEMFNLPFRRGLK